jgi:hypothetical protein
MFIIIGNQTSQKLSHAKHLPIPTHGLKNQQSQSQLHKLSNVSLLSKRTRQIIT